MNSEDKAQWYALLYRLEQNGNDGADVYEAEEFCKAMEEKYGKPWKELQPGLADL